MKNFILLLLLCASICGAFIYGFNKSADNRCDYYKTLPNYSTDKPLQNICK